VNHVMFGDALANLRIAHALGLRAQMCVTSPPYFGLRSYLPSGHPDKPLEMGSEATPDEFIARLVEVFAAVRDVLADDGTLWVNIGDSYASRGGQGAQTGNVGRQRDHARSNRFSSDTVKEKDLIGIPWMLAFALRADGWYLRQGIIWHKPNPMPESVTDRCTKAHEDVFLLSKGPRYFFDSEAVKEPAVGELPISRMGLHAGVKVAMTQRGGKASSTLGTPADGKRNRRSVWTIATKPYKGAHSAVFPPALIEPCILAGSRPGDIVLDPFMGSGTTAAVALKHGRQYFGCELNADNAPLIAARVAEARA
jgi:DNA modification methylase